jgi:glycerophosphoryl diester phosphodiesterase
MNSPVLLIHHAANRGYVYPPNSVRGLKACLDAAARAVEMDISPLSDGDFLLLHDRLLENGTTGSGLIYTHTAEQVGSLFLTWQGAVTDEPVGLLSQALDLVSRHPYSIELQLDLKAHTPLDNSELLRLLAALQPVKDRVRVTSGADWALRRLRALDPDLPLGFDPMLYLDLSPHQGEGNGLPAPPFRHGAYGYWDDHPLAIQRWGEAADYLAARAEALWAQAPSGAIWYIRAKLLARALTEGFDWIADLHRRGTQVDAWTLNPDIPADVELARQLVAAGVDRITTDNAPALAQTLAEYPQSGVIVEY